MGRITVFAIDGCPHCLRAKKGLADRDIPYVEINLSSHPSKRSHMLALSDSLTVPQVFFNEKHIGGAEETIALLERWDEDSEIMSPETRYRTEIEPKPDPTDVRLQPPTEESKVNVTSEVLPRNDDDIVRYVGPDGEATVSMLDLTSRLVKCIPRSTHSFRGYKYKDCFTASQVTLDLQKEFGFRDEDQAVQFASVLQSRKVLHFVLSPKKSVEFQPTDKFLFRLQPHHTPNVLNSFRIWTDRVDPDSLSIVSRLKSLIDKITSSATDDDGNIDLSKAALDERYDKFQEEVCELRGVDMSTMDVKLKTAFVMNVYNLMIQYSQIKVGVPSTNLQRVAYFTKLYTCIGGQHFSFNDLENGILRANSKAPYNIRPMFSSSDPRIKLSLDKVDHRIHFGLNCGARSCPPVKKFTALDLEEELRIVALAFCEQDENFSIDEDKNTVKLSTIFNWYREDFAESSAGLPRVLLNYLRGERKETLQRMIKNKKNQIKVGFITYDWSSNVKNGMKFDSANLSSKSFSLMAFVC